MAYVALFLVALVALEHIYILVLEMFLWTTPRALKTFGLTPEFAASSKALAANQGLYNGFLAAGLIWGLIHPNAQFAFQLQVFFLACVIVAAIYGADHSQAAHSARAGWTGHPCLGGRSAVCQS